MGVFETYSKRKKKALLAGKAEVYQYDLLPDRLRVQIQHILRDAIGSYQPVTDMDMFNTHITRNNSGWEQLHKVVCKELGVHYLGTGDGDPQDQCLGHVAGGKVDEVLDLVELAFLYIDRSLGELGEYDQGRLGIEQSSEDAIEELNQRFAEHAVGYRYVNGQIIRVDSQFIHEEVVKSALTLIHDDLYAGAEEEFRKAHEHYRHERYKESLNEALKAFESVAKSICMQAGWEGEEHSNASKLVARLYKENFIPQELQSQFTALRAMLESSVPTVRNKMGGHGQGQEVKPIPKFIAGYVLHMTASAIVFLVEAYKQR